MTDDVEVRPLELDDHDDVLAFLGGLSLETLYRRFFSVPRIDERLVEMVVHPTECCSVALVAHQGGRIVGVATYDRVEVDPTAAEVAIVIADEWQHRGVGSTLMRKLGGAASRRGIERFTATMLSDNRAVVDFVHTIAPVARLHFDGSQLAMDLPLLRRPA